MAIEFTRNELVKNLGAADQLHILPYQYGARKRQDLVRYGHIRRDFARAIFGGFRQVAVVLLFPSPLSVEELTIIVAERARFDHINIPIRVLRCTFLIYVRGPP